MSGHWLDRLALRAAGAGSRPEAPPEQAAGLLDRADLLRRGAIGVLAIAGLGAVRLPEASAVAVECVGGSLKGCNRRADSISKAWSNCAYASTISVAERIQCFHEQQMLRKTLRNGCKSDCKGKGKKGAGSGGGAGGGGTTSPPGGGGNKATCGEATCVTGDKCCPLQGVPGNAICCVVGCHKSGNGCCSSDSDCG